MIQDLNKIEKMIQVNWYISSMFKLISILTEKIL